ncbi:MAG: hypothetical protein ACTSRZ_04045 [Promethearchaeota archaeon]
MDKNAMIFWTCFDCTVYFILNYLFWRYGPAYLLKAEYFKDSFLFAVPVIIMILILDLTINMLIITILILLASILLPLFIVLKY